MDNFNNQGQFNGYDQNQSNYTFNNQDYNNQSYNNMTNNPKKGNIGVVASVIQWAIYLLCMAFTIVMALLWAVTDFDGTGMAIVGLVVFEGVLQVIPGVILAIMQIVGLKQKVRPFVVISLVINIVIDLIGGFLGLITILGLLA